MRPHSQPPLGDKPRGDKPRGDKPLGAMLAKASWAAPLIAAFAISLLTQAGLDSALSPLVMTAAGCVFYLVGLGCGLAALGRVGRDGRKGVLLPGLIGSALSGLLLLFVIMIFWSSYQRQADPAARLTSTLHDFKERDDRSGAGLQASISSLLSHP